MPGSKHRELRKSRHLSLTAAAVYAGVSEHTLRCYELDPNAVNDESRRKLDGYFAQLASTEARAG